MPGSPATSSRPVPPWRMRSYAPRAATSSSARPDQRRAGDAVEQRRQRHLGQLLRPGRPGAQLVHQPPRLGRRCDAALEPQPFAEPVVDVERRRAIARQPRQAHELAHGRLAVRVALDALARLLGGARQGRRRPRAPTPPRPGCATTASRWRSRSPTSHSPASPGPARPGGRGRPARAGASPSVSRSATSTRSASSPSERRSADSAARRLVRADSACTFGHRSLGDQRARLPAGMQRQPRQQQPRRPALGRAARHTVAQHPHLVDDLHLVHLSSVHGANARRSDGSRARHGAITEPPKLGSCATSPATPPSAASSPVTPRACSAIAPCSSCSASGRST